MAKQPNLMTTDTDKTLASVMKNRMLKRQKNQKINQPKESRPIGKSQSQQYLIP